jgi:hypothetical protein
MDIINAIILIIVCAGLSFIVYGIWKLENDRYEFRKKHGFDPKYHGWDIEEKENDKNQNQ